MSIINNNKKKNLLTRKMGTYWCEIQAIEAKQLTC